MATIRPSWRRRAPCQAFAQGAPRQRLPASTVMKNYDDNDDNNDDDDNDDNDDTDNDDNDNDNDMILCRRH